MLLNKLRTHSRHWIWQLQSGDALSTYIIKYFRLLLDIFISVPTYNYVIIRICIGLCLVLFEIIVAIAKSNNILGCLRGVMVKAMDCGIVVSEFLLQSRYYFHFRANTLRKGMKPLILPSMRSIVPLLFFSENGFGIE